MATAALYGNAAPSPPTLRFGVNYTPRKQWWYCWQDWDAASLREDLEAIAGLNMDHIRVQCLWPYFQPGVNDTSEACIARLETLLEMADAAGLDVQVTVLNGWMSGFMFMPAWVAPLVVPDHGATGNIFTDPFVIEGENLLFTKLARACLPHRRFLGFDLGNELGVLMGLGNFATPIQADRWSANLFSLCQRCAPGKFHVNGVDHEHWFSDLGFTRTALANQGAATVIHCYAQFTGALARYGASGVGTLHLPEYMTELAFAYQNDLSRPVWLEEIGVSPEWVPENEMQSHAEHLVRNSAATGKLWGITWWSSHDLNPSIHGFNRLEYTLGLLDQRNQPKPLGKTLARLASELRHGAAAKQRPVALSIPRYGLSHDPRRPDWSYASAYMKMIENNQGPSIILEDWASDPIYLQRRGIHTVVPLAEVKL